ncbi:MAG: ACT domain-containing protein [Eubacteriales bacterium]|nr:ACT domain-containing protein [Eubacteriales bacterium]
MAIKQISILLENKQGKLADITRALADAGINLRAMSIAETQEYGMLRLIVSDPQKVKDTLQDGTVVVETEVVAVKMSDDKGGLADVLKVFDKANVNIDYAYAFTGHADGLAYVVFRVDDNLAAEAMLKEAGFKLITQADL